MPGECKATNTWVSVHLLPFELLNRIKILDAHLVSLLLNCNYMLLQGDLILNSSLRFEKSKLAVRQGVKPLVQAWSRLGVCEDIGRLRHSS